METPIRDIGNSKGVVIPKLLLAQAGLEGESTAMIQVVNEAIVLSKSSKQVRAGWAEAAAEVCAQGE